VEFNHNQDVQTDMQELRNSLVDVRSVERIEEGEYEIVSEHQPARVRLGTQYPARLIALNPPNPAGSLQTEDPASGVTIENAEVTNADAFVEPDEVQTLVEEDFENGFQTKFISYQPQYNEYRNAPETTFEHSLLYNNFQENSLTVQEQQIINSNNRLRLLLFSGDVSRSSGRTVTLDPETIDGPTAPIDITGRNDNDGNNKKINITLPTNEPAVWKTAVSGIPSASVIEYPNKVTIQLDGTQTYHLRVARVVFDGNKDVNQAFTPIQSADVGEDAEPAEFYPNSGSANTGTLEDFNNLRADDGDVASFLGDGGGGSAFDIDIVTNDVPSGDYTLEISVSDGSFQGGGVDVIVDGDTVATISETGQTTVDLTGIGGDVAVTYQGRNQNSDIDVDYQRLVEN